MPYDTRNVLKASRYFLAKTKSACGANAQGGGGFQPGNTCAAGESAGNMRKKQPKPKEVVRYVVTKGDFEKVATFLSPTPEYAGNYGSGMHRVKVQLGNGLDLTRFSADGDVSPQEVSGHLASYGIDIKADKMGTGEIHQVLMPVRSEIARQAKEAGFDHWVQNENFDGANQVTEYVFKPDSIVSVEKKRKFSVPITWSDGTDDDLVADAFSEAEAITELEEEYGAGEFKPRKNAGND